MIREQLTNGITLCLPEKGFGLSTDSVLLAHFARVPPHGRVADLGAGVGTLGLFLLARQQDIRVTGIELQERACALARENIAQNALQARFELIQGDVREHRTLFKQGSFDCVVSNPPYFPAGTGANSPDRLRAVSRTELCLTLEQLCQAAAWLLPTGGAFFLVHRPERLCDLFCALRGCHLEPKRLRFVRHAPDMPVSLVLIEARRGGKPGLELLPELLQFTASGQPCEEYRRIYHLSE